MYPRWAIRLESLVALPPERASFGQTSLSSGRLAQHGGAVPAEHHGLGVAKHSCDGKASLALHILQHTHSKKPHHVRIGIAKHHRPIESLTHGAYQEFSQNLHMRKKGGKARYCQRPKKCQQRLA